MYVEIGRRIRELRRQQHMTQEQLAEKTGISLSFMGHIERGSRILSVDTLVKLTEALHCSADLLLGINGHIDRDPISLLTTAVEILERKGYTPEKK